MVRGAFVQGSNHTPARLTGLCFLERLSVPLGRRLIPIVMTALVVWGLPAMVVAPLAMAGRPDTSLREQQVTLSMPQQSQSSDADSAFAGTDSAKSDAAPPVAPDVASQSAPSGSASPSPAPSSAEEPQAPVGQSPVDGEKPVAPSGGPTSGATAPPTPSASSAARSGAAPAAPSTEVPAHGLDENVAGDATIETNEMGQIQNSVVADMLPVVSATVPVGDAILVGGRWEGDGTVAVRTLTDEVWSQWQVLARGTEHVPDDDSAEAPVVDGRASEPLWIGGANTMQFRSDETTQVTVFFIDSTGGDGLDWTPTSSAPAVADAAPAIRTRADWGADESLREGSVNYSSSGSVRFSVLHHVGGGNWSAGEISNGCRRADDWIRSIYQYHTQVRNYWDIGYNFIVDPCGTVWEGRYGGIDQPVVGAHAGGFNDGGVGVLALGTFSGTNPDPVTASLREGITELLGWKLGSNSVEPGSTMTEVSGGGSARWPSGTSTTVNALSAHQITNNTTCPGELVMAALFNGRGASATPQSSYVSAVQTVIDRDFPGDPPTTGLTGPPTLAEFDGDAAVEGVFHDATTGDVNIHKLQSDGSPGARLAQYVVGSRWTAVVPIDVDGDGRDELVFHDADVGLVAVYRTRPDGRLLTKISGYWVSPGWTSLVGFDAAVGGAEELGFHRTGDTPLVIYRTGTTGTLGARVRSVNVGSSWTSIRGVDLDADGHDELLMYAAGSGRLRSRSVGMDGRLGTVRSDTTVASGWAGVDGAELGNQGRAQLMFSRDSGATVTYDTRLVRAGDRSMSQQVLGTRWDQVLTGDFTGNGRAERLYHDAALGTVLVYSVGSSGRLGARLDSYRVAPGWSRVLVLPTATGPDQLLFYAEGSGRVLVYDTDGKGGLSGLRSSYRIANGWTAMAAMDVDGDGVREFAVGRRGYFVVYRLASNGRLGAGLSSSTTTLPWDELATGDLDGDGRDELAFVNTSAGRVTAYQTADVGTLYRREWSATFGSFTNIAFGDSNGRGDDEVHTYVGGQGTSRQWAGNFTTGLSGGALSSFSQLPDQ